MYCMLLRTVHVTCTKTIQTWNSQKPPWTTPLQVFLLLFYLWMVSNRYQQPNGYGWVCVVGKKVTKKVRHAFLFGLGTANFGPIYGTGLHIALGLLIESRDEFTVKILHSSFCDTKIELRSSWCDLCSSFFLVFWRKKFLNSVTLSQLNQSREFFF